MYCLEGTTLDTMLFDMIMYAQVIPWFAMYPLVQPQFATYSLKGGKQIDYNTTYTDPP